MIGQTNLINILSNHLHNSNLPRFMIFVGPDGSGKKTLVNELINMQGAIKVIANDIKVATIKELIEQSYKVIALTTYVIPDADDMSLAARNSLLKVTEEPPNNAYWILTVNNIDNVLPTIRSRGTVFNMDTYSKQELLSYLESHYPSKADMSDSILKVCEVPGDIDELCAVDTKDFFNYANLVIDNIAEVSGANAFKIAERISLKKDSDGYPLELFWNTFRSICVNRWEDNTQKYADGILITNKYANELGIRGINKDSLFDAWILDIRKAWMNYGDISS